MIFYNIFMAFKNIYYLCMLIICLEKRHFIQ